MMPIKPETIEKARRALKERDAEEAKRVTGQLPEIPPLKEGETVATFIPKRKKK